MEFKDIVVQNRKCIEAKTAKIHIRQANIKDITTIEEMYRNRVLYNDANGTHQWDLDEVTWDTFSQLYTIEDYYVGVYNGEIVCGMFIVNVDELYWPDQQVDDALYLHKIITDPKVRGLGFAHDLIAFFQLKGKLENYKQVRLDVRAHKDALRSMYEKNGFRLVCEKQIHKDFLTALYDFPVSDV